MTPGGVLRSPLLHFLLLGAMLHALKPLWPQATGTDWDLQTIRVSAAEQQQLARTWQAETGRKPSAIELQVALQRHIEDQILLREALKLGLHQTDSVVRQRLVANMRFAFPDSTEPDEALFDQALALDMQASDLVARSRLIQLMQMRIVSQANLAEAELREYVARHPDRYAQPARVAFRHLFFSTDSPSADALQRAQQALRTLQAGEEPAPPGDPFLLGQQFSLRSQAEIARQFGPDFALTLMQLPVGSWAGPVRSPFGVHLVQIEQVEDPAPADYERVSQRAAYALLTEREQQLLRETLARLRLEYHVQLPESAAEAGT